MSYGFKLTGVTIPDGTTSINAVISDGTTPTEYALTGSVADGFSGTGISAVCTADGDIYDVDITVDALTSEDVGDEYTINLSLPEAPTESFANAVHMVVGNGGGAKTIIYVSQSDLMNFSSGHVNGYKDDAMTTQFAPGEITVESDLVVYCVYNDETTTTFVPFMNSPAAGGNPGICIVLVPGQNGVSAIRVEYYDGK